MKTSATPEVDVSSHYAGVQCAAWRSEPHGHTLVGFADLEWNGFVFHDVSVHGRYTPGDPDGVEVWVSFPVRRRGKDGQAIRMVHFKRQELYDAWQKQAVAAVLAVPEIALVLEAMEKE